MTGADCFASLAFRQGEVVRPHVVARFLDLTEES
jgi:hypothetical protein